MARIRMFLTLTIAMFGLCLHAESAKAKALNDDASQDFADASTVSDEKLSTMRGGFINAHGLLINFNFTSTLAVNGNVQNQTSFTSADLVKAASHSGGNIKNIIPPTIIQNVNNNTNIALQQVLNLNIANANIALINHAQFNQAIRQNALAFH